jgi:hypothetical protein
MAWARERAEFCGERWEGQSAHERGHSKSAQGPPHLPVLDNLEQDRHDAPHDLHHLFFAERFSHKLGQNPHRAMDGVCVARLKEGDEGGDERREVVGEIRVCNG